MKKTPNNAKRLDTDGSSWVADAVMFPLSNILAYQTQSDRDKGADVWHCATDWKPEFEERIESYGTVGRYIAIVVKRHHDHIAMSQAEMLRRFGGRELFVTTPEISAKELNEALKRSVDRWEAAGGFVMEW